MIEKPSIKAKLSQLAMDVEVGHSLKRQIVITADKGLVPLHLAGATKIYSIQIYSRLSALAMEILGPSSGINHDSEYAPMKGKFNILYQTCTGWELAAGSTEIHKNIIAQWALGFPRT